MEPVAIHRIPIAFSRSAIRVATLGSAMSHELAQGLRDLFLGPLGVSRAKRGHVELTHLFHESQANGEPQRGHPFTQGL